MHQSSRSVHVVAIFRVCLLAAACMTFVGCAYTTPSPGARWPQSAAPLAEGRDELILASISNVIRRNDANAWARDADWDEYLIRIRSVADGPIEIRDLVIIDALDHRIASRADRSDLVDGTLEIEQRYERAGLLAPRRRVNGWLVAGTGVAAGVALAAREVQSSNSGFLSGGGAGPAVVMAAIGGMVFVVAGAKRLSENSQVNSTIQQRRTKLPISLPAGAETSIDLFFPVTPQSVRAQVVYSDGHGEHRLTFDTYQPPAKIALEIPTLVTRVDPEFPDLARRAGIDKGYVKARLSLNQGGHVHDVDVIESVPLGVFTREARRTFYLWKYSEGNHDWRSVEATLEFKR